jgi:hypothetical protein
MNLLYAFLHYTFVDHLEQTLLGFLLATVAITFVKYFLED